MSCVSDRVQEAAATVSAELPAMGVEEEYQLVDPNTGGLVPNCRRVMRRMRGELSANIQHELHMSQIEMASPICHSLAEVRQQIGRVRRSLIDAAREAGCALVAAGTNPTGCPADKSVTPKPRYTRMAELYQRLARDLMIFGCHVHISMPDRALGVQVMNHARPWLPLLQALSANSPYWEGEDTGYASYRREMWMQWPMAGPPHPFADIEEHDACVNDLIEAEAIDDATKIYWDLRLPARVPTIEFRVFDVMTTLDEVVAMVGLVRALVMGWTELVGKGVSAPPVRQELLLAAMWRAARFGTEGDLIDPVHHCPARPEQLVEPLLEFAQPALRRTGDEAVVRAGIESILKNGTGAARQRQELRRHGSQSGVVNALIAATSRGAH